MKKYTLKEIKDLPCMKMEEFEGKLLTKPSNSREINLLRELIRQAMITRNKLRHQLLEELKGEGK